MQRRNATSRMNASGVVKIKRDTYATTNGFSKKNAWWEISAKVRKRDKNLCQDCLRRKIMKAGKEVHHIVALARGGTTTMANLILLCGDCHDRRHPGNHHLTNNRK